MSSARKADGDLLRVWGIFDVFRGDWTFVLALMSFPGVAVVLQVLQWFPSTRAGFPKCPQPAVAMQKFDLQLPFG